MTLKVQAMTTERTSVTYKPQWIWYGFATGMINELRKNNVGVCKKTGNNFGQLMQNFVLALDGAFIMADAGRNFRIIGDSDREKYEKIIVDR